MAYKISRDNLLLLRRAVSNFNAKIKRLEKVDREIGIPEKVSTVKLKTNISSKWDLNREIKKLERFTQRHAEDLIKNKKGVVRTRWEFENIQREQRRLSARLKRDIEKYGSIKPSIFGKTERVTYAQMGDERLSNLRARQKALTKANVMKMNAEELKNLEALISKTSAIYKRDKSIFYDSYLDGTLLNLSYQTGYDRQKVEYIREKLKELSETQFIKAFNTEAGLKDIQDKYIISKEKGVNIEDLSDDVNTTLDELYKNIDKIVADYK